MSQYDDMMPVELKAVLLRCLNHEPDSLGAFASVAAMEGMQFQD
jgi:hypothetical protein